MADVEEEDEHHELFKERRKRKDQADDEPSDKKKTKGLHSLRFATVEQAKRAVTELKNPVLKEKLKHYGVENVKDLTLVEDSNNAGMTGDLPSSEERCFIWVDRPAKVSFADSFIDPGDEIMAQVKTVFIDGLSSSWDEDRVRVLLKKYGEIEKIELARNMPSARRKDFGFVTFDTHDAAVTCAKSINNAELGEGDNKARLSRPLQRGKGKHLSRGDFRSGYGASRVVKGPWVRPVQHSYSTRAVRGIATRAPHVSLKSSTGLRERRPPMMSMPARSRPLAPPFRSFERRPPPPSYTKSLKREYGRRDEPPPSRSRPASTERRPSYRDEYSSRGTSYADLPEVHLACQQGELMPMMAIVKGTRGLLQVTDDIPPRYADAGVRHSRPRLDYELGSSASQYGDAYGDRLGVLLDMGQQKFYFQSDSHGCIVAVGMGYGGSYGGNDGGMYSSSYGGDYMPRGGDAGGSSYSSMYSSRGGMGSSSSYMGTVYYVG
uniref:RRM domain-containing protein n=1 Tax=Salix viminalis TaxID=40686 RepID=A0A6N2MKI8_SALVM